MKDFKKKLFKVIPYVSIGVIVLTFGFFFIPHCYVMFRDNFALYSYSGFEVAFNIPEKFAENFKVEVISAATIVLFSFMALAIVTHVFANKLSAVKLLAGVLTAIVSFMFFATQLWLFLRFSDPSAGPAALWMPYINGTLTLACAGITIWASVEELIAEKNAPLHGGAKSYSYLKK